MPSIRILAPAAVALLSVVCLILSIVRENASRDPNNQSRLNRRQFTSVMLVISLIAIWAILLYLLVRPFYVWIVLAFFFIMEVGSFVFWFYDPFLYVLAHFRKGKTVTPPCKPTPDKQNRFAVIGCAHNEEKVIAHLIESVYRCDYDRNLYDFYVICDNCTDRTADVVRASGAIAMERHDLERRGKSFGLSWMFGKLKEMEDAGNVYDAYIVLDADNLVSTRFFRAINRRLNEGHEFMQCYLGCKNPDDSWISRSYSVAYWLSNLTYQKAHMRLGLSAQMGGTGMVFRPAILNEIGWPVNSLTEDLLITTEYMIKTGRSACWVHDARIYDEKPLKLKESIVQRTRWMQGHMRTCFQYFGKLVAEGFKHASFKHFDLAFYLARPLINICMFAAYVVRWLCWVFVRDSFAGSARFMMNLPVAVGLMIGYLLMQCIVLYKGNRSKYILWTPIQFIFSLTWYPAILRGLIKNKETYWVSTMHTRALSIDEAGGSSNGSGNGGARTGVSIATSKIAPRRDDKMRGFFRSGGTMGNFIPQTP